ncbi:hypothetical protein FE257_006220 [Aspergillus nanangensis]|uniref:UBC core domain-containing protein n=1 Tax=Aspergillus nanangensis TaxID=2582783 RepID=A0AAD4GV46_ASPNN|nr:hypothetical protein FE257_006220 [Aspergillus nanangensis]
MPSKQRKSVKGNGSKVWRSAVPIVQFSPPLPVSVQIATRPTWYLVQLTIHLLGSIFGADSRSYHPSCVASEASSTFSSSKSSRACILPSTEVSGKMVSSLRRLAADHAALHDDLPPNYILPLDDSSADDLTQLTTLLTGPQGTPYSQGLWRLHLKMPGDYPKSPPKATFKTRIWHPNVEESTGAVCVDTLKRDWKSTLLLKDVLITISCLLIYPNPDSALNSTAGALLQENYDAFARQAKLMTSIHALVPPELKDAAREAKARGEDVGALAIPEQEDTVARTLRSRKGIPIQSVTMKQNTRRSHRESTPPLVQQPGSQPLNSISEHYDGVATDNDEDDESENGSNASKENDPTLSPLPVKFAPPSPRKNALGKRPLSVLTMPIDFDDPFAVDEEGFHHEADGMTASEKNIAANCGSETYPSEPDVSPQRKSPKLSILHRGVNSSGRLRDDVKIFEDTPETSFDELDRRRSGDGKENRGSFGGLKDMGAATRKPHANQHSSVHAPSMTPSVPSSSKDTKAVAGSRKVSTSNTKKTKPRTGLRRL